MSGSIAGGGTGYGFARPNTLIDVAGMAGAGERDALNVVKNELMIEKDREALANDRGFRAAAPGILAGDPDAARVGVGFDPAGTGSLLEHVQKFGDTQRKRVVENMSIMAQAMGSLLDLSPEDQQRLYPQEKARLKRDFNIDLPGDQFDPVSARHLIGQATSLAAREQARQFNAELAMKQPQGVQVGGSGGPPAAGGYVGTTNGAESGGQDNAKNPRSSATGRGQFIDGTWLDFAKSNPGLFPPGATEAQILAMRNDGALSDKATAWYREQNLPVIEAAGFERSDTNAGLAHWFGPGGAVRLLTANKQNPATPMEQVFPEKVMKANPELQGKTVGDVVGRVAQRYGGQGGARAPAPGQTAPAATTPQTATTPQGGARVPVQQQPLPQPTQAEDGPPIPAPVPAQAPQAAPQPAAKADDDGPERGTPGEFRHIGGKLDAAGLPDGMGWKRINGKQEPPLYEPAALPGVVTPQAQKAWDEKYSRKQDKEKSEQTALETARKDREEARTIRKEEEARAAAVIKEARDARAPESVIAKMIDNVSTLRQIDRTFDELLKPGRENSVGPGIGLVSGIPWAGQTAANKLDPEGIRLRAGLADLSSAIIHLRSGQTVTVGEMPRLSRFLPEVTDDARTIRIKLAAFRETYADLLKDMNDYYGKPAGGAEVPGVKEAIAKPEPQTQTPAPTGGRVIQYGPDGKRIPTP